MTRKHYQAIVEVFNRQLLHRGDWNRSYWVIVTIMTDLAGIFARDNPAFDRDRFIGACMKDVPSEK